MPPKRGKKLALSEFLQDAASGSWADEMENLPSAPALKEGPEVHPSRRDDFLSSKLDRAAPIHEDIPLPTRPPYTAFVGNLAFDLVESDLEVFFQDVKSVKIIKDREDKPKGFGYVEFRESSSLKEGLSNNGRNLAGRIIRVSVAEPPKERSFGHGPSEDNAKFDTPWRRDGPLPDLPNARDQSRRKYEGAPERLPSVSDSVNDWRSQRATKPPGSKIPERKGSGFLNGESPADKEEVWSVGSKFKLSSVEERPGVRLRTKAETSSSPADEGDWRSRTRPSPSGSNPSTPPMGRKKLELLPRSDNVSASPSPLSSPEMGVAPVVSSRSNPFGGARPVDVTGKEKEISQRVDKDRDRLTMSRTSSRTASERPSHRPRSPPTSVALSPRVPSKASNVKPTLSFANVAANKVFGVDHETQIPEDDKAEDNVL